MVRYSLIYFRGNLPPKITGDDFTHIYNPLLYVVKT